VEESADNLEVFLLDLLHAEPGAHNNEHRILPLLSFVVNFPGASNSGELVFPVTRVN
jgi:hypothetical protein